MESLLRWGIEHSTPDDRAQGPPAERKDLDPGIIDAILGKSDAEQMKEDLSVATNTSRSEDDRVDALDHLEMLIEQIDNANNLEKLQMWKPLHELLTQDASTSEIIMQALWVIGTALQNNPAAQDSYLALDPLPVLTSLLDSSDSTPAVRSKVIYTLSGLLKHNAPALASLGKEGWMKLRDALQDPDITVRRKAAFLLSTLLIPSQHTEQPTTSSAPIHANSHASHLLNPERAATSPLAVSAMSNHRILPIVIDGLTNPLPHGEDGDCDHPDPDFEEKSVGLLRTYAVDCNGKIDPSDKETLRNWISQQSQDDQVALVERWGMSQGELKQFIDQVQ